MAGDRPPASEVAVIYQLRRCAPVQRAGTVSTRTPPRQIARLIGVARLPRLGTESRRWGDGARVSVWWGQSPGSAEVLPRVRASGSRRQCCFHGRPGQHPHGHHVTSYGEDQGCCGSRLSSADSQLEEEDHRSDGISSYLETGAKQSIVGQALELAHDWPGSAKTQRCRCWCRPLRWP